ncbi:hypothetical protein D3C76_646210 [compost metagenome]
MRTAGEEAVPAGIAPGDRGIGEGAEVQRQGGAESAAHRAHTWQAEQAVDQAVADRRIGQVHDHQGAHVHAGAARAVPVAAEGEVQPDRQHRQGPPLEVGDGDGEHIRIAGQAAHDGAGEQHADQGDRQRYSQRHQQAAIQWSGQFAQTPFAVPPCNQRLDTGAQPHYQGDGDEVGVAADTHAGQGLLAEMPDHGGIHQVEQALAEHPADDRQTKAENVLKTLALEHDVPAAWSSVVRRLFWMRLAAYRSLCACRKD